MKSATVKRLFQDTEADLGIASGCVAYRRWGSRAGLFRSRSRFWLHEKLHTGLGGHSCRLGRHDWYRSLFIRLLLGRRRDILRHHG